MNCMKRLATLLLALLIFMSALPLTASAVATYGGPTADPEELVIDYGKGVVIEEANLKKHIHLKGGATNPTLVGLTDDDSYTNGQILSAAPNGMGCTTASSSMDTTFGKLVRASNRLTYTPSKFLTGIEYLWAVYSFTGYSGYLLVEIRIIPAPQIYYEAEDFKENQIQTIHTTDGGKTNVPWSMKPEDANTETTTQSFDQVGDADFNLTIDHKCLPVGSFFADFDGEGYNARFKHEQVYGGNNFDSAACWFGSKSKDSDYIETTPGHLVIPARESESHYVQTITSTGDGTSSPLAFVPSKYDFFEVRFRAEGVKEKYLSSASTTRTEPFLKLQLGIHSDKNVEGTALEVELDYDALKAGGYITARIPLKDWSYYTSATMIYKFRLNVYGIKFNADGNLFIDYIYMGPMAVPTDMDTSTSARNFLFFGFDTWTDKAYYDGCSLDGTLDFSKVGSYYSDYDSSGANGSGGLTLDTGSYGTLSFNDKSTTVHYNFLRFGSTYGATPLRYKTTGNDYFKIRFKVSGGSASGTPVYNFDYRLSGESEYHFYYVQDISISNSWQEIVYKIPVAKDKTITNIEMMFANIKNCSITIDYIAVYPASLLTKAKSKLYMDFRNTDYTELMYSTTNYDNHIYMKPNTNVKLSKSTGGFVMADTTPTAGDEEKGNDTRLYFRAQRVNITPGPNHYFRARIYIQPAVSGGAVNGTDEDSQSTSPLFSFYYVNEAGNQGYVPNSFGWPIDLKKDLEKWIVVTIPIQVANYNSGGKITQIVPALLGTQGAKVTFDYIYVGPLKYPSGFNAQNASAVANPASKALYFGFDNDQSDKNRYTTSKYRFNDTYCGLNYDTGNNWATSSFYSDSTSAFTVNNTNGIVALNASTKNVTGDVKGPCFVTTKTKGTFAIDTAAQKSLKFHPQYAEIFQIRFRLNGCTIDTAAGEVPELRFLFGGYAKTGDYTYQELTGTYPDMTQLYHDTDEFQTVTIAVPKEIRNMTVITNFGVRFFRIKGGTIDIDYIYLGPKSGVSHSNAGTGNAYAGAEIYTPYDAEVSHTVYGYDGSYTDDTQLSNGRSMFVEGNGVRAQNDPNPTKYTEASFSFTGTGFDLISRTGLDQGAIRVEVRNQADGTLVRSMSVNNKGDLELYQIPVVSIQGLAHGSYTVTIGVNQKVESEYEFLKRGDDFYLDGIRIYDTVNVKGGNATGSNLSKEQKIALNAYRMDQEAFAYVREIRDSLLTASDFSSGKYSTGSALFIDTKQIVTGQYGPTDVLINSNRALNVATYNKLGPKNEVYLSPGQAVAFKLNWGTGTPVGIDIGAKSVLSTDGSAVLAAGFVSSADLSTQAPSSVTKIVKTINTATPLYYELDASSVASGSYLVLYNAHTGTDKTKNILSLTDLKICYQIEPSNLPTEGQDEIYSSSEEKSVTRGDEAVSEPFRFEVDERVPEAAALFLNSVLETPVDTESPAIEELAIYHSLNLASDISVNYLVPVEELECYDTFYMSVGVSEYEDNALLGHRFVYPEAVKNGDFYYFTLLDMDATRMNDMLEATIYMTKDGKEYHSVTDIYSVAEYAYNQLSKEGVPESLKTLCANLLNYGTAAQNFKGYRTDALANAAMTEAERAYCTDPASVIFGNNNVVLNDMEHPSITWVGKSLNLGSKVELRFVFDTASYEGEPADLNLHISYTDAKGSPKAVILEKAELYGGAYYVFTVDTLLAAELRTVLSARIYDGDTPVSVTLQYSPDTYGNNKSGTLLDLCKALFAYSDSAKAYFAP